MRSKLLIAGLAVALAGATWLSQQPAAAQGWGMMGGYGPGYHMGWGGESGAGYGPWNCPGFAQANNGGPGYGPGYGMRGWRGGGYGPGYHMRGWGGGYGPGYGAQSDQTLNLSTDDVKTRMERWLEARGNPRLKVGEVKEKDADTITADIVTKDNALVDRIIVDRHTGFTRRDNS
jgi:hypothetical protein